MTRMTLNLDFRCKHCGQLVSTNPLLSGVHNRNHCPYCLWSRHLDWKRPGDRLAACKAEMRPLGLTVKKAVKKYALPSNGELMLIHQCVDCGKLSINRIAADDDAPAIDQVYQASRQMAPFLRRQLAELGIQTLRAADRKLVNTRLFGGN
jgi:DNA-directed RNA polymerase subunit RPC12/RpoP